MRQDVRLALRALRAAPGLSMAVVLTLALGIGVNTSVFSAVEATLLRPLPFAEPDRLVAVFETRPNEDFSAFEASYPNFLDWRAGTHAFAALAGWHGDGVRIAGAQGSEFVRAAAVTGNFFRTLGVRAQLGRTLEDGDDRADAPGVVVLSGGFWERHFGGDASIVGRSITLDGKPHTVVGVMPARFAFAPVGEPALWTRLAAAPAEFLARRNLHWVNVVGRLGPGATLATARADLQSLVALLTLQHPVANKGAGVHLAPLSQEIVGRVRPVLLALLVGVGLVLLIACVNAANLMLSRQLSQKREMAIRLALGASRGRLVRQVLTETALLGLGGGGLGLLGALWGTDALLALVPDPMLRTLPALRGLGPNGLVIGFAFALAMAAGVLAGLVPALALSAESLAPALQEESRGTVGHGRRRLRSMLVLGEVALAFVLLVGAGLVTRSLWRMQKVDPGFDPHGLLTASLLLPDESYPDDARAAAATHRLLDELGALPGVQGAAVTSVLPLGNGGNTIRFLVPGGRRQPSGLDWEANIRDVSANYFQVMRVPLGSGRAFAASDDAGHAKVVVVNRTLAERVFPGESAVGRRIVFTFAPDQPPREIVGVVADEKQAGLDARPTPTVYLPIDQDASSHLGLALRTDGDPDALAGLLRAAVARVDGGIPVFDLMTMEQRTAGQPWMFLRRFPALLAAAFAFLALALAAIGLYGVLAYAVGQRQHEIGIRRALGAQGGHIARLVVAEAVRLLGVGLALGFFGAWAGGRLLASLLFDLRPGDPPTLVAVALLVLLVGLGATLLPLRRAVRIDPMEALR